MQQFRMAGHIYFDAATAFLYTASIAIVIASEAAVYSQMLVWSGITSSKDITYPAS
jgi:hypothetical protein